MQKILVFSFMAIVLFLSFSEAFAQQYTKYVTVNGAGSHDGSSLANAMTLAEARSSVVPGDYVFLQKGDYALSSQSLSFGTNGTATSPIIWEGEITDADLKVDYSAPMSIPSLTADKVNSTVITYSTASNGGISMGGDYNYFRKIVFNQEGGAFNLINVTGDYVQLDSCAVKYPSNASSSSNHTVYVRGGHVTFKHTSFYNGSRCIIWVRDPGASNFLMENCKLTNATNHPPIQIMPTTNSTDTTTMKRIIVRNNIFYNNPYSDGIYWRHLEQMAFYNNLFIRSSTPYSNDVHTGIYDSVNTKGGIIAYNTVIENTASNFIYNVAANQVNFMNNLFYTTASQDIILRYGNTYTQQLRHKNDYNLIYSTVETYAAGFRYTWNGNTSTGTNYTSATGQGANDLYVAPTFTSIGSDDYSPLNSSSPQVGKGSPITRANGYWMDITTDFFGNPRDPNNPTIGAIEYNTGVGDIFPPNLLGAIINNATTVTLNFSEPLSSSAAQNINNYSINNGISVSAASVSGSQVVLTTSEHSGGSYTITVNNLTDLAGNVINPNSKTATYNFVPADITPPSLLTAMTNNSTTLVLSFSEPLTQFTAQNVNNYSINNGINVTAASLSGSQVTLTTSAHSSGSYTVTVNNVTDLAGNVINPTSNTANYEYSVVDLTAPQVVSAAIIDSVTLRVLFSENLESSGAVNLNNYAINNISIINATLSSNAVTLVTSVHPSGTYTVTVSNVTDLAGNTIDPQSNSASYNYIFDNIPPDVSNLSVTNVKSITLNFSEKINPLKANDKTNYSVSNNVVISSAQILPDSMSVLLKTSSQQRDKDYTLTIRNISDKVGNNISPNPKQVYYRLPKKGKGTLVQSPIEKAIANSWDQNYLPEKTIDGEGMINSDSRWKSNKIMPDTINYDMGKVSAVDLLSVSFYKWESNRKYKFSAYSSVDSISWQPVINDVWSDSSEWTEVEFDSTQARYIKLVLKESNQSPWASIWEVELFGHSETNINNENNDEIPTTFSLTQNYPNPFNPKTTIEYSVSKKSNVTLKIFDMLGSEVETLIDGEVNEGKYTVDFNATGLTSGIYFYRLQSETNIETKKMILLK